MDFDDHRAPRSDVCILLLHHNIGDALVLCVSCVQIECILQIKMYIGFVRVIHECRSQVFIQQCNNVSPSILHFDINVHLEVFQMHWALRMICNCEVGTLHICDVVDHNMHCTFFVPAHKL